MHILNSLRLILTIIDALPIIAKYSNISVFIFGEFIEEKIRINHECVSSIGKAF